FSIGVLAALAVIAPLIDEPSIEKAQSPAMNPVVSLRKIREFAAGKLLGQARKRKRRSEVFACPSFFNIFDFLNIKCISPFHFCKEKEPDFGSFVCTF
ncbi:hypothetical protein, partial [Ruminococcus sp.]|uniref:hypothetical protein n=1 Tax=Ruminococcus sp. TaxID=41978 RepID=UPI00257EE06D